MLPTRRHITAGLLGAGAASSLAGRVSAQPAPEPAAPDDGPPTSLDTGQDRFEHMLAPVSINGLGPFQFLMDTGANTSCVSRKLADKLSLKPGLPARVHTVVGVRERPSVLIDHLQVGARARRGVNAAALPIDDTGVDGVLGVDWLNGQRLILDFKRRNLEITKSIYERSTDSRVIVPARRRMGQLTIIDADLGGRRISAIIDSGSQLSICNSPLRQIVAETEARRHETVPHELISMVTLAGEPFSGDRLYLPFMRLGGLHLGNVPVVHADMYVFELWDLKDTPAIVLGMDLLTQFGAVALDFGASQVRFDMLQASQA